MDSMSTPIVDDSMAASSSVAKPVAAAYTGAIGVNHHTYQREAAPAASDTGLIRETNLQAINSDLDVETLLQVNESLNAPGIPPTPSAQLWDSVVEQLSPRSSASADQIHAAQSEGDGTGSATSIAGTATVSGPMIWPAASIALHTAAATRTLVVMNGDTAMEGYAMDTNDTAVTSNVGSVAVEDDSSSSDDDLPLSMRATADPLSAGAAVGGTGSPTPVTVAHENGLAALQLPSPSVSPATRMSLMTSANTLPAETAADRRVGIVRSDAIATSQHFQAEFSRSTSQDSADVIGGDGSRRNTKRVLPKIKRSERCGHCHTCQNRQLKQACLTVRAKQEAEAHGKGDSDSGPRSQLPVSATAAAARKRPRSDEAPADTRTPFTSSLGGVIGSNNEGGLESVHKVSAMLHLMASQDGMEQRRLLVEVVHLSSAAVKSVLAGGRAVELLGAWLLEAAVGGAKGLAFAILACLDSLPIGMSALRTAKIGKTMSRVKKIAATELHAPAAALIDKWRTAVGTASTVETSTGSRATEAEPPGKRAKAASGKVSMVNDDEMFRSVPLPQPRPPSVTARRVHEQVAGGRGDFDPRAESAAPGTSPHLPRAPPDAAAHERPTKQHRSSQPAGGDLTRTDQPLASPHNTVLIGDGNQNGVADPGNVSSAAAPESATEHANLDMLTRPTSPSGQPSSSQNANQHAPLQRASPFAPPAGTTTRIGGLSSGLGSSTGPLMSTSAVSRWGPGASGRAAEAASRIPSPPPIARDPSRRRISWRIGADIAAIRFFNKADAPIAVASDAELADPEDNEAVAAAVGLNSPLHPPAFENAARQEHLSEAAALRGHQMAEKQDPSEVSEQQAFSERYQAMAPSMPWLPPPPVTPATLWACGEESTEVSNEDLRQSVVRPVNFGGMRAHVREPPVHDPEVVAATPLIIPLQPMIIDVPPDTTAELEAAVQLESAVQPQLQLGVPYQSPSMPQSGPQQQHQWQSPQQLQALPPQQQWQQPRGEQQQQFPPQGQQQPIPPLVQQQQPYPGQQQTQIRGEQPPPSGFVAGLPGPASGAQQAAMVQGSGRTPQHGQPGQSPLHRSVVGLDPQWHQQQQQLQNHQRPITPGIYPPPSVRPPAPSNGMMGGLPPLPQLQQHFPPQQPGFTANGSGQGRGRDGRFGDSLTERDSRMSISSGAPGSLGFLGGIRPSPPGGLPGVQPHMQPVLPPRGPPPQGGYPGDLGSHDSPSQAVFRGPMPRGEQAPMQHRQLPGQEGGGGSSGPGGCGRNGFEDDKHRHSGENPLVSPPHEHGSGRGGRWDGDRADKSDFPGSPPRGRGRGSGRGLSHHHGERRIFEGDHRFDGGGGGRFESGHGRGRGGRGEFEGRGRGRGAGVGIDPESKRRICLFFNQAAGCRKGDTCSFAHVHAHINEEQAAAEFARISRGRGAPRDDWHR